MILKNKNLLSTENGRKKWIQRIFCDLSVESFNQCFSELCKAQYKSNPLFKTLLEASSFVALPHSWSTVPALSQKIFKLAPQPPFTGGLQFHTSGTTEGKPGIHCMKDASIYEASVIHGFPWKSKNSLPILSLHPSFQKAPHSSLSFMIQAWMKQYGSSDSAYFYSNGKVDSAAFWKALQTNTSLSKMPLLLIGSAFSFVHLIDDWKTKKVKLHPDSILMETGGYKGRSRELSKKDLYQKLQKVFGISDSQIWNEYGMTELSSQAYAQGIKGIHKTPPWARVVVIDPKNGCEVKIGETGLVKWIDLANVDSCLAIQTLDFATRTAHGFILHGRAPHAPRRGCSLTIES